jgi:hypothetical protein
LKKEWWVMSAMLDNILYIFFYVFPLLMLFFGYRLKPNISIFPVPLKMVDLITPYLLISVSIQTYLAGLEPAHLYFYILLSLFGIGYASYLAFSKRVLIVGSFFRTWWRYTFIFTLAYHLIVGGYGIYVNFF